jgi:anti-anti-sigma factor
LIGISAVWQRPVELRASKTEVVMAAATFAWQTWNSGPFTMERKQGKPGTVIHCFRGPFTVRDAYSCMEPQKLNKMLDLEPAAGDPPTVRSILDMTACTSVDSSGLGLIATHLARCNKRGVKLIAAGLSPRVKQVFLITSMDRVIPMVATVEEAESQ